MVTSSVTPYHPLARALHWALALLIVGNFALGIYMADLPFSPARLQYYSWHKWAGVLVLAFSAVRLLTRILKSPPALPPAIRNLPSGSRTILRGPPATSLGQGHDASSAPFGSSRR